MNLPSAPHPFLQYFEEDNRPQTRLDRDFERGMGISLGRLRGDSLFDWRFVGLSHNTLRGAAGGAVLPSCSVRRATFRKNKGFAAVLRRKRALGRFTKQYAWFLPLWKTLRMQLFAKAAFLCP